MVSFFLKQKTAYEMRISDWSSDVCSSDLVADLSEIGAAHDIHRIKLFPQETQRMRAQRQLQRAIILHHLAPLGHWPKRGRGFEPLGREAGLASVCRREQGERRLAKTPHRSEEHTSELQSLMRISYAVFC